jgi:hypothetical protein
MRPMLCLFAFVAAFSIVNGANHNPDQSVVESLASLTKFNFESLPKPYRNLVFTPRVLTDDQVTDSLTKEMSESVKEVFSYLKCHFGCSVIAAFKPSFKLLKQCYFKYPQHFEDWKRFEDLETELSAYMLINKTINNPTEHYKAFFTIQERFTALWKMSSPDSRLKSELNASVFLQVILLTNESIDDSYFNLMSEGLDAKRVEMLKSWRSMDMDQRWKELFKNYEAIVFDGESIYVVRYLRESHFDQLLMYASIYGSPKFHRDLRSDYTSSKLIIRKDLLRPDTTSCFRPQLAPPTIYLGNFSLPNDLLHKIFFLVIRSHFVTAVSSMRRVCQHWNRVLTFKERHQLNEILSASPVHAKKFIFDVILQYSRNAPTFNVQPWMPMSNKDARSTFTFLIESCGCSFNIKELLNAHFEGIHRDFLLLIGLVVEKLLDQACFEIFQLIMDEKVISEELAITFFNCVASPSFVSGSRSVWPTVSMFLDKSLNLPKVKMTVEEKLKYFESVFSTVLLKDGEREAFLMMCVIGVEPKVLCEKALILFHFYGSMSVKTVKFVLDMFRPELCHFLESKEFVFIAPVSQVALNDERARPELDYIIREIMNGSPAQGTLGKGTLLQCLKYICINQKNDDNMACVCKIITLCMKAGITEEELCKVIMQYTVGI